MTAYRLLFLLHLSRVVRTTQEAIYIFTIKIVLFWGLNAKFFLKFMEKAEWCPKTASRTFTNLEDDHEMQI